MAFESGKHGVRARKVSHHKSQMVEGGTHGYPKTCKFTVMEGDSAVAVLLLHRIGNREKGRKKKRVDEGIWIA